MTGLSAATSTTTSGARKLKLGIAGLGRGFTVMLPTLALHKRLEVVAAVDTRPAAGVRFEADFGGTAYDSVEAMCAEADIDAVYVATPHQFHAEHTEIAARCRESHPGLEEEQPPGEKEEEEAQEEEEEEVT